MYRRLSKVMAIAAGDALDIYMFVGLDRCYMAMFNFQLANLLLGTQLTRVAWDRGSQMCPLQL